MQENTTPNSPFPIALAIAGSDSSGGAGVQADIKTFSANGVYAASVITAVTAQNTQTVTAVHEIPADVVAAQIRAVLNDLSVDAIKIGMLFSADIIAAVAEALRDYKGAIVLDPVMISKSGARLLQSDALETMISQLLPRATLLTPNLPEAAVLIKSLVAETPEEVTQQAHALLKLGPQAVLLKGGHSKSLICEDFLLSGASSNTYTSQRINSKNTHGTGCTFAAAITANIAKGKPLETAVAEAHSYLQNAISTAVNSSVGQGNGPVHHFAEVWPK